MGDDDDFEDEGVQLHCVYKDGVEYVTLCLEELYCTGATPANACSEYWSGDVSHSDLWEGSFLRDPCNDGEGTAVDLPESPCVCDHGTPEENDEFCDVPPPLDPYDYPDGYPLPPGMDPTGGEDPTGGTEPMLQEYVCGDPLTVQDKCVYYNHVVDPLLDPDKMCWVDHQLPDTYTVCVTAVDDAGALIACEDRCEDFKIHANGEISAHNPPDEVVEPLLVCDLDGLPRPKTANDVCDPQTNFLIAWGGSSQLRPFYASAMLSTPSGGSTTNRELSGYLAFEITNCTKKKPGKPGKPGNPNQPANQCDFTIDALEGVERNISGIFTDANGAQTLYVIENLDFRLTQDVSGVLNLRSKTVVFPEDPFAGIVWASDYSVAGMPMGNWASPIAVSQAVGRVSASGSLTLNLTFNWADGVFTTTFVTY